MNIFRNWRQEKKHPNSLNPMKTSIFLLLCLLLTNAVFAQDNKADSIERIAGLAWFYPRPEASDLVREMDNFYSSAMQGGAAVKSALSFLGTDTQARFLSALQSLASTETKKIAVVSYEDTRIGELPAKVFILQVTSVENGKTFTAYLWHVWFKGPDAWVPVPWGMLQPGLTPGEDLKSLFQKAEKK